MHTKEWQIEQLMLTCNTTLDLLMLIAELESLAESLKSARPDHRLAILERTDKLKTIITALQADIQRALKHLLPHQHG